MRTLTTTKAVTVTLLSLAAVCSAQMMFYFGSTPHGGVPSGYISISPGTSIQTVVNANPNGSKFYLRSGVHRMQSVVPKQNNQFLGETGASINGSKIVTGWTLIGGYWTVGGQTENGNPDADPNVWCFPEYPVCTKTEDLFVNNVHYRQMGSLAAVGPGQYYFNYGAQTIQMTDNPTGKTVEVAVTTLAFSGFNTGIVIDNLTVEKYANPEQVGAIHAVETSNWTIRNNIIQYNHGGGLKLGSNNIITNNHFLSNGQIGIIGSGGNTLVDSNEIAYNNLDGYNYFVEAGGTKFAFCESLMVSNNYAHDNFGPGLWTDIANYLITYDHNTAVDNFNYGINHEISYDAVIKNNYIARNGLHLPPGQQEMWYGGGIIIGHSPNVEIYNNTLIDNVQGIGAVQTNRGDGPHGVYEVRNMYTHDNFVTQSNGWYAGGIIYETGYADIINWNNRWVHNTYTLNPNPDVIAYTWAGNSINRVGWQAALPINQDVTGTWIGSSSQFISSVSGGSARNDVSGYVGMYITVGGSPIAVNGIGRYCSSGSGGTHAAYITNAATNAVMATATINMASCAVGTYVYATVSTTLAAGVGYYVLGAVTNGGPDSWLDNNAMVTHSSVASLNSSAYTNSSIASPPVGVIQTLANSSYGPMTFRY